jgi:hypothetical protein
MFLGGEDRFDGGAYLRARGVCPGLRSRQRGPGEPAEVDLRDEAILFQMRFIGLRPVRRVRPNLACRVALVENLRRQRTIMSGGTGHRKAPDKAMRAVNRDVIFIAKDRDGDLDFRLALFA